MKTDKLQMIILGKWSYNVLHLIKYKNNYAYRGNFIDSVYHGNFIDSVSHYLDL